MSEIKDGLLAIQKILREECLPHLAAQVPVDAPDDFQAVRSGISVIDGLLRLRPPPEATRARLDPFLKTLLDKINTARYSEDKK